MTTTKYRSCGTVQRHTIASAAVLLILLLSGCAGSEDSPSIHPDELTPLTSKDLEKAGIIGIEILDPDYIDTVDDKDSTDLIVVPDKCADLALTPKVSSVRILRVGNAQGRLLISPRDSAVDQAELLTACADFTVSTGDGSTVATTMNISEVQSSEFGGCLERWDYTATASGDQANPIYAVTCVARDYPVTVELSLPKSVPGLAETMNRVLAAQLSKVG